MKSVRYLLLSISLVFASITVSAMNLDQARSQNLVVEKPSGYVEAKDPKAKALAKSVNAKRKKAYENVAKKTRTSIDVVGAQAHKKIMEKLQKKD